LKVILWSLDSKDWESKDPKEVVSNIVDNAKPGDIILCHDVHKHTVDAMEEVLDKLTKQGYEFLTISQVS
jgi:peptidoglycan/xylan/chitin deacetylase (PgdA/CDA1 family)